MDYIYIILIFQENRLWHIFLFFPDNRVNLFSKEKKKKQNKSHLWNFTQRANWYKKTLMQSINTPHNLSCIT